MDNESVKVLKECIDLQVQKGKDYQNPNSSVKQAMYYPRGIHSIHDVVNAKKLRIDSLLESGNDANFESLEDSYKDLINYASFAVSWLRGQIDGQNPDVDMFNHPKKSIQDNSTDEKTSLPIQINGVKMWVNVDIHPDEKPKQIEQNVKKLIDEYNLLETVNTIDRIVIVPGVAVNVITKEKK